MTETTASVLVAAIETVWTAIQERHPDVPDVIVTLGAGSLGKAGGLTLGHFAHSRWVRDEKDVHELFVGGEGLARGDVAVLGTMLHEAAHGIAATRGIQDTSRQGRYHNKKFAGLAEEVGIVVEHDARLGWSTTGTPARTAATYGPQLMALHSAITAYRRAELGPAGGGLGRGGRTSSNNGSALACGCGRKIRASLAVIEAGPIVCGLCQQPFTADEPA